MLIPFLIFFYLYLALTVVLLGFGLASLFHLLRFGFFSPTSVFMTFVLISGTIFILFISKQYLAELDWQQNFDVLAFIKQSYPF